jgi:hypothetical protein
MVSWQEQLTKRTKVKGKQRKPEDGECKGARRYHIGGVDAR